MIVVFLNFLKGDTNFEMITQRIPYPLRCFINRGKSISYPRIVLIKWLVLRLMKSLKLFKSKFSLARQGLG